MAFKAVIGVAGRGCLFLNREGFTMEKKADSKFIGAGVWSILFTTMGIF